MPLTLTIRPNDRTPAPPPPLRLDGRAATIGRGTTCDWVLADERATISSRHCEIAPQGGFYVITDTSTNGTSINGRRIAAPQRLNHGDAIGIGPYEIIVAISADAVAAAPVASPGAGGSGVETVLRAAGVRRTDVAADDATILEVAGQLLREFAAGTSVLVGNRDRARDQIGVAATAASGKPGLSLPALLGDGGSPRRIADAFNDLDAHQLATLKAAQGAMKATLDVFSPAAIRAAAGGKADDAALWQAYQRAFGAADTGFGDTFAAQFRAAYDSLAKRAPRS